MKFSPEESSYIIISSGETKYKSLYSLVEGNERSNLGNAEKTTLSQSQNKKSFHRKVNRNKKDVDCFLRTILGCESDEDEDMMTLPKPMLSREFKETQSSKANIKSNTEQCHRAKETKLNEISYEKNDSTVGDIPYKNNVDKEYFDMLYDQDDSSEETIFTAQTQKISSDSEIPNADEIRDIYDQMDNIFSENISFSQCSTIVEESCEKSCEPLNDSKGESDDNHSIISSLSVITSVSKFTVKDTNIRTLRMPANAFDILPKSEGMDNLDGFRMLSISESDSPLNWNPLTIVALPESSVAVHNDSSALRSASQSSDLSSDMFDERVGDNTSVAHYNSETVANVSGSIKNVTMNKKATEHTIHIASRKSNGELLSNYSSEYVDIDVKNRFKPKLYNKKNVGLVRSKFLDQFSVDKRRIHRGIKRLIAGD